jgi:hypothetical protein
MKMRGRPYTCLAPRRDAVSEELAQFPHRVASLDTQRLAGTQLGDPSAGGILPGSVAPASPLHQEWGDLAERVQAPPFIHPGWIAIWADAFADRRLSVLGVRREGRLVGLMPLLERAAGTVSPTNWHTPLFGILAEDDEARAAVADRLVEHARHRLDIAFLDAASDDLNACRAAAARARHRTLVRTVLHSPFVETDGDFEEYARAVGGKTRRELRRRRRRLADEGRVSIEFVRPNGRLAELLADGFAVEGSGWKAERGTAIVSRPDTRRFYTNVAQWAAERDWLVLGFRPLPGGVRSPIRAEGRLRPRLSGVCAPHDPVARFAGARVRAGVALVRVPWRRRGLQTPLGYRRSRAPTTAGLPADARGHRGVRSVDGGTACRQARARATGPALGSISWESPGRPTLLLNRDTGHQEGFESLMSGGRYRPGGGGNPEHGSPCAPL